MPGGARRGAGGPRHPTELKVIRGTTRSRDKKKRSGEPAADPNEPRMPTGLTSVAKNEWKRVTEQMRGMGVLSKSYERALELYVVAYGNWRMCSDRLKKEGPVTAAANGNLVRSPWAVEAHNFHNECYRWLTEFGLTPVAKSRVLSDKAPEQKSDWAKFMDGSKKHG